MPRRALRSLGGARRPPPVLLPPAVFPIVLNRRAPHATQRTLVQQLFQLQDGRRVRRVAALVALRALVRGARGATGVHDVTLLADVADVDGGAPRERRVARRHEATDVGEGAAVLGVVGEEAVVEGGLGLDLFNGLGGDVEQSEGRAKVGWVVHEEVVGGACATKLVLLFLAEQKVL